MSEPKQLPLVFDEPRGRKKPPRHLADLDEAGRKDLLASLGLQGFRAKQLSTHYFGRLVDDPGADDRPPRRPAQRAGQRAAADADDAAADAGGGQGHHPQDAVELFDGALVESVLMRYPDRATVCVSSQAGCGMACPFCATGQGGLQRNLSTAEIVEQVVAGARSMARREDLGAPAGCPTSSSWEWGSRWPTTRP